jgi:fructose-specific phosphotransferase system IIA component
MLLVIMHNDKKYLDKVLSIIYTEGIPHVSIFEKEGIAKSLRGIKDLPFSIGNPEMVNEFDYALIAAVPGEEKIDQLNECIQAELRFQSSDNEGLLFTLPYDNIERLFRKIRGDEEMIRLANFITEERVCLDLSATDKVGVIKEMVELLGNHELITDKEGLIKGLIAREELETTGIGDGIALPHARIDVINELTVAFGRSEKGVEFEALDDKPVYLVFLILAPRKDSSKVLKLLAGVCRILRKENFRQALLSAENEQEIIRLIEEKSCD